MSDYRQSTTGDHPHEIVLCHHGIQATKCEICFRDNEITSLKRKLFVTVEALDKQDKFLVSLMDDGRIPASILTIALEHLNKALDLISGEGK